MRERELAEQHPQQRRLARPVGPEDRRELALADLDVHAAPDHPPADAAPAPSTTDTTDGPRAPSAVLADRDARRGRRAHRPVASWSACDQAPQLGALPLLEGSRGRRERLGDGRDRDVGFAGELVDPLHVGGGVLAVVDPHLDRVGLGLAVDRLLVLGADVGSLGDRLGEAVGGHQLQPQAFAQRPEDALRVADRDARVAGADLLAQAVVFGQPRAFRIRGGGFRSSRRRAGSSRGSRR